MFPTFEHRAKVFMWLVDDITLRFTRLFRGVVLLSLYSVALASSAPLLLPPVFAGLFHAPVVRPPLRALRAHLLWVLGWGGVTRVRTRGAAAGLGAREVRLPHACRRESVWLLPAFTALVRGPSRADTPVDLTAVDRLGLATAREGRFLLWYLLATHRPPARLAVAVPCLETASVPSLTPLHPAWGWPEREVWDMFGVRFYPHPDLRRILTDYAFRGFPLRKDFPVVGFKQVRYDEGFSAVVYEDLFLMQDEREPLLVNPWLGGRSVLGPRRRPRLRVVVSRARRRVNVRFRVMAAREARRADPLWKFSVGYRYRRDAPHRDVWGMYDESLFYPGWEPLGPRRP